MSTSIAVTALASCISLALLLALIGSYRRYLEDQFRQTLFSLRDDLFDDARNGSIAFDQKAYGMLRMTLNGYIRYAHKLRFRTLLAAVIHTMRESRRPEEDRLRYGDAWVSALSDLSPAQREIMLGHKVRMDVTMLRHVLTSSPVIFSALIVPAILVYLFKRSLDQWLGEIAGRLATPIDEIDANALSVGEQSRRGLIAA